MINARYNVVVVGGGIIGLAVALESTRRFPQLHLLLVEKEDRVARHQSGHNSGVVHSGVYYKPGSLKARLCVAGAVQMNSLKKLGVPDARIVSFPDGPSAIAAVSAGRADAFTISDLPARRLLAAAGPSTALELVPAFAPPISRRCRA